MDFYKMINMFSIISFLFPIFFMLIFGLIMFRIIKGIGQWRSNNKQPILNVEAEVVAKRTHVSKQHNNNGAHVHTSTTYYVTFQVQSGDRMEFVVPSKEYGMLVEGDRGNLIFQGTRYHGFHRE